MSSRSVIILEASVCTLGLGQCLCFCAKPCMEAAKKTVELANEVGTGHVTVRNSSHFGAAAVYALEIASHDMIGMSLANADALVKSYGGKRRFLGNNSICFARHVKAKSHSASI